MRRWHWLGPISRIWFHVSIDRSDAGQIEFVTHSPDLRGLGGAASALGAHQVCLLYLVAQLPLPLFFRFVVLVQ